MTLRFAESRAPTAEIRRVIEDAHQRAKEILLVRADEFGSLSQILLRRETIEREEFVKPLDGAGETEVFAAGKTLAEDEELPEVPAEDSKRRMPYPPAAGQPPPEA